MASLREVTIELQDGADGAIDSFGPADTSLPRTQESYINEVKAHVRAASLCMQNLSSDSLATLRVDETFRRSVNELGVGPMIGMHLTELARYLDGLGRVARALAMEPDGYSGAQAIPKAPDTSLSERSTFPLSSSTALPLEISPPARNAIISSPAVPHPLFPVDKTVPSTVSKPAATMATFTASIPKVVATASLDTLAVSGALPVPAPRSSLSTPPSSAPLFSAHWKEEPVVPSGYERLLKPLPKRAAEVKDSPAPRRNKPSPKSLQEEVPPASIASSSTTPASGSVKALSQSPKAGPPTSLLPTPPAEPATSFIPMVPPLVAPPHLTPFPQTKNTKSSDTGPQPPVIFGQLSNTPLRHLPFSFPRPVVKLPMPLPDDLTRPLPSPMLPSAVKDTNVPSSKQQSSTDIASAQG